MAGKPENDCGSPPFELALEQHGPRVHAWLTVRVGPDRADDVFQETMLAALRAWEEAPVDSVRAWLFAIAKNKAIDEDRRARRRPLPEAEIGDWPAAGTVDRFEDPVWGEVRSLPPKQRMALTLRYRADLTYREIGNLMDISEPAARRNVFEGLKSLRERMENE